MMGKIAWYKRDPIAALDGMRVLSLEERGAYNTVLDLIYSRDGNLPDDDRFICGWLGVDLRVWKRIKARLITLGKLYVRDGLLGNPRADAVVHDALAKVVATAQAGRSKPRKSAAVAIDNSELAGADDRQTKIKIKSKKESKNPTADLGDSDSEPEPVPEPTPEPEPAPQLVASRYRWAGNIIKLNERDFDRWQRSFSDLDLEAHLTGLDAWLSGDEANDKQRKSWFNVVPNALCKRQQTAVNERKRPPVRDYRELHPEIPG